MSRTNSARLRWAFEVIGPRPHDRVLEIGCGVGAAVELVAARLVTGTIRAIDPSSSMVEQARARNAAAIAAGRARIDVGAVSEARLGREAFDTIFAFNVGLFWQRPAPELPAILRALRPTGALLVFHQAPVPIDMRAPIAALRAELVTLGLDDVQVRRRRLDPVPATCVIARRARTERPAR